MDVQPYESKPAGSYPPTGPLLPGRRTRLRVGEAGAEGGDAGEGGFEGGGGEAAGFQGVTDGGEGDGGGRGVVGEAVVGDQQDVDAGVEGEDGGLVEPVVLLDRAHTEVVADDDAGPAQLAAEQPGDRRP